jgi:hypothetical protein
MLDGYGISKKGQQDRRWAQPKQETAPTPAAAGGHYGHLRIAK